MNPLHGLRADLESRKVQGLYRSRRVIDGPQGVLVHCDGRELLSFCSNDYLGLASDPRLAEAMREGTRRYGVGSGAATAGAVAAPGSGGESDGRTNGGRGGQAAGTAAGGGADDLSASV